MEYSVHLVYHFVPSHFICSLEEYYCRLPPSFFPYLHPCGQDQEVSRHCCGASALCVCGKEGYIFKALERLVLAEDDPLSVLNSEAKRGRRHLREQESLLTGISPEGRLLSQLNEQSLGSMGQALILLLLALQASLLHGPQ